MRNRLLFVQLGIIAFCLFAVTELVGNFPYPSPLIKPLLPPKLRWPGPEVAAWVESQNFDPGFLEFFYRDPERVVPPGQNLVSPADGVLLDNIFEDGVSYFIVALSFWDVHVVRTPVAGVVKNITSEGYSVFRDSSEVKDQVYLKGKAGPVQQIVTLDTDYGEVRVRLITSYWASRLKVWVHEGDRLKKVSASAAFCSAARSSPNSREMCRFLYLSDSASLAVKPSSSTGEIPMMRLLWRNGRLSWPLLIAVGYLTLSFLILDFVWRRFVMPFDTLLIYAALGDAAVAIILVSMCLHFRRFTTRRNRRSS